MRALCGFGARFWRGEFVWLVPLLAVPWRLLSSWLVPLSEGTFPFWVGGSRTGCVLQLIYYLAKWLQNGCVLQAKIFSENVACFKNG